MEEKIYSTKEVAKRVRQQLKKEFPACKFSVTCEYYSGGSTLHVSLISAPFKVFAKDVDVNGNLEKGDYAQLNYFQLRESFEARNGLSNSGSS